MEANWDLDHRLAEDLNQGLALKPGRSKSSGNYPNDSASEGSGPTQIVMGSDCRCNGGSGDDAVDEPRLGSSTPRSAR